MLDGVRRGLRAWLLVAVLVSMSAPAGAVLVSCDKVIAKSNELARRGSKKKADVPYIAKKLGADPRWVERCFQSYGRRITRHAPRGSEATEDVLAEMEEFERQEPAKEEDLGYTQPLDALNPLERRKPFPKWEDGDGKWPKRDKGVDHRDTPSWPRRDKGDPQY